MKKKGAAAVPAGAEPTRRRPVLGRRWVRISAVVLAAVVVLAGGYVVHATAFEHRSVQSKVVEDYLWATGGKGAFTDPARTRDLLAERRVKNEQPATLPTGLSLQSSISLTRANGMQVYVFGGAARPGRKEILYLHGGAYINQALSYHFQMLAEISRLTGARVVMPVYPLAPVHRFGEAYRDVLATYRDLLSTTDHDDITLMGDSAGGGFALGLAQVLRTERLAQPKDIVLLSPWLDLTMSNPGIGNLEPTDPILGTAGLVEMGRAWAGSTDPRDPRLSPINGSLAGLGHLTVLVGTHELFNPDARRLRDLARNAGVDLTFIEKDEMDHVYPVYPTPEGEQARRQIAAVVAGRDLNQELDK